MPRLRRADCSAAGIRRRRAGRGFSYSYDGQPVRDPGELARIRALVIPPAWSEVWICPWPNGHIQALGTDAAGRRQYRYHDAWRARRDQEKFDHMVEFGRALPGLRQGLAAALDGDDLDRTRVLACAARLLDIGFFRIGTEGYAEQNQSYGLATMLKRHVRVRDGTVAFDYLAKGRQRRLQSVVDPAVYDVVAALKRRRAGGPELLAYREDGGWCDVRSEDINAAIKEATGGDFSAKDFRTWNATTLAAVSLAVAGTAEAEADGRSPASPTARKRTEAWAMQSVAHYLGNTPAVCRASYVDPRVVDRYRAGTTIAAALPELGRGIEPGHLSTQGAVEVAVLDLLAD